MCNQAKSNLQLTQTLLEKPNATNTVIENSLNMVADNLDEHFLQKFWKCKDFMGVGFIFSSAFLWLKGELNHRGK